jgi:hypothetical protein
MDGASELAKDLNLDDIRIISELVERMHHVQKERDEVVRQFAESVLRLRPTFDLVGEVLHVAAGAASRVRENLPTNWPRDSKLNNAWHVLAEDGIPIVYVPRADIVGAILREDDYESRVRLLLTGRREVVDDCRTAINQQPLHPHISDVGILIQEAITLLEEKRFAGAQSLAANVCDTIIRRTMPPRPKYPQMIKTIEESYFDDELLSVYLAFRPVLSFYAPWWPGDPTPPPTRFSRHRTSHDASPDHMSEPNATIAVMLATSLSLAVTMWWRRLERTSSS